MNYLDLFSGIGGFYEGFKQAGFNFKWVGFSEIDKYATSIYKKHFPDTKELGTIESIKTKELPRIDLVTFGFPCQDLSIAGKREGIKSSRSGLFFEAIRIIRDKRPKYFIFENVKGLFSSNRGQDFEIILRTIADIGYDGQWQLLNTRWFLPQNRERIYFVGHIRGKSRPKVFPIGESNKRFSERTDEATNIRTLQGGGDTDIRKRSMIIQRPHGFNKGEYKELPSLRGSSMEHNDFLAVGSSIRRLTPIECERLQGFPDNWAKYGFKGELISNTQRYKMLGNAVSIPVVKAIAKKFKQQELF